MSDINANATLTFIKSKHTSVEHHRRNLLLAFACNVNICCFSTCGECCVFQNYVQCFQRLVYHLVSSHRLS